MIKNSDSFRLAVVQPRIIVEPDPEKNVEKAKKTLEKDFKPISDMRASKNYRMEIAKNLLMKCLMEIKDNKLLRLN